MGTITGRQIVDKASKILLNAGHVRWKLSELLAWLNSGFTEVVIVKPSSYTVTESVALAAGARQDLPAGAHALIALVRNMGADGNTPGPAIGYIERKILDTHFPLWSAATQSSVTELYTQDVRTPRTFYVFPPATGTSKVEMAYSALPAPLTDNNLNLEVAAEAALAKVIPLYDIYENALIDYVLFRAYCKDHNLAASDSKAAAFYAIFLKSMGIKATQELQDSAAARHASESEA